MPVGDRWRRLLRGSGRLEHSLTTLRFINREASADTYTNAQIDDYRGRRRRDFLWMPPLTLSVRARFSHSCSDLIGTAGFGFWNDPFMMTEKRRPTVPQAIWFFFASSASCIKLDYLTPGHGWKAATIDARRWQFYALAPVAPLAVPLMNLRPLYRRWWPFGQRAIGVSEQLLAADMTEWITYELDWGTQIARFRIDDAVVMESPAPPRGPLGFVAWLDNQYAVVTPWGRFGHGLLGMNRIQWMELDHVHIVPTFG